MPTADTSEHPVFPCRYITTCWAHEGARAPTFPVKIGGRDTEALLDSGSMVTLIRPEFAGGSRGKAIAVACIHGDTKQYFTADIVLTTPRGSVAVRAGVVENLPVPVLVGRDCAVFDRYWKESPANLEPEGRRRPQKRRPQHTAGGAQPAWAGLSGEDQAEPTDAVVEGRQPTASTKETTATASEAVAENPVGLEEVGSEETFTEFAPQPGSQTGEQGRFGTAQLQDPNLTQAWRDVQEIDGMPRPGVSETTPPYFLIEQGLLYRVSRVKEERVHQLLVPKTYISKVLYLAHTHLLGAHLGAEKTYERIIERFYWPGVKRAVEEYCRHCADCQLHSPKVKYKNPLIPLPIIEVPFHRIAMDIVGPLPRSSRGHKYILVILDYATRFPEAIPLRTATGKAVARELFLLFSRVGIAAEILTDQGSCFMSTVLKAMCGLLKVKQVRTSVYHPQTDGLVERFNHTLKQMMRKMIETDGKDWDQLLPYLMFAIREVPQASTGFSPFELLYGRRPRGLLDLAKETWERQPSRHGTVIEHVEQMHLRMSRIWPMVRENMQQAQQAQARVYNRGAQDPPEVTLGKQLTGHQIQDLRELLDRNRDVFSKLPGRTSIIAHHIATEPGKKVRLRPYRIPEAQRDTIREEVRRMLEMGVIEESHSSWSSPIVIVPKPDGSLRFCNDFRKLNEISRFDAYPMPRVDELIERLGPARFLSTLDLTRGYWQVPLTPQAKEKTAFVTPDGLFQYRVLPFGVHGAPATFQRLMDQVLRPHQKYAAAYLDDIVVHSADWETHLGRLEAVLGALREAGLTANATKCRLGLEEADYLGYTVGRGCVKPQPTKVEAIATWPKPQTQKQVRTFLGLVGYYRQFIPNFAAIAAPLHDLTSKSRSNRVSWTEEADAAFETLRQALCSEPVLVTPAFDQTFVLQTDASLVGIGAVLSQIREGAEHPVTYISRKLLTHERNYATVEKECLAVKWAMDKLRYYLLGREFVLVTDHAPLKWMSVNKDSNARVTRWFLGLQSFRFRVEHRAGKLHGNADALSRREECLWSGAPGNDMELREGVCGAPIPDRCSPRDHQDGRTHRHRRLLGKVVSGRYLPNHSLETFRTLDSTRQNT
ncbi:uncharacterized protein LOC118223565 isoform X2 [Anguilla anguilla]|uniref:uncharacterized protein LOC118223565 isoform X2 n=1 Tax=Anguilla anguilla TaxID=7936 RepID=UPI0015AC317E|nr:uncharacterized protein LOC118223565 isoform X2 [Anguilla anguilla]